MAGDNALHTHTGGTDAQHARLAQAGLLAVQGPTMLDARTGVLVGPGSRSLISGTSSTAPMRVSIAPHQWVTSRGAAYGPYLGKLSAAVTVDIAAAPGSGTRVDVVWVKQADSTPGVPSPDAATAPMYGVKTGTVGQGKPTLTDVPGAVELGTVTVLAGATRTDNATLVTIANTARQTVARGAIVPVQSQAERDQLTQYEGLIVDRADLDQLERSNGSSWKRLGGEVTLGSGFHAGTGGLVLAATPAWSDVASVTATSFGGECDAEWIISLANANSGADRSGSFRVVCDGVQIGGVGPMSLLLANLPRITRAGTYSSTPGAGSHTWKLQANGSAGASVVAEAGSLRIREK